VQAPSIFAVTVAGLRRELPVVEVAPGVRIASFVLLGDAELVEACAEELAARMRPLLPAGAALVGPEAKVLPLLHAVAVRLGARRYVVCRKAVKAYMEDPLVVGARSITTPGRQQLVLDGGDAAWLRGRAVALLDDVVSTGGTLRAMEELMARCGARVALRAAVLREGEGVPGVLTLGCLPVWRDGAGGPPGDRPAPPAGD
jgi:adenine phosphoribosyltransferase